MSQEFWTLPRIAGGLLVASVLIVLAGLIVITLRGNVSGLAASFQDVAGKGEMASALRTIFLFSIPSAILQLLGFGLLTIFLHEAGNRAIVFAPVQRDRNSWSSAFHDNGNPYNARG